MPEAAYFFDTVTLSNFALADALELLLFRYRDRLKITDEVLDEIVEGVAAGYSELGDVVEVTEEEGDLPVQLSTRERRLLSEIVGDLGRGEASCVAAGFHRGGVVVTDDKAARDCCSRRDIPFTGTIGILKAMCLEGQLSVDEADDVLGKIIAGGFYSPVRRIRDIM